MKTLNSVVRKDEKAAKIVGLVINSLLTIAGAMFVIYGVTIWASHYAKF